MHVTLDEHRCESTAASVGEAIADAAATAEERGRVIVEVIVDGSPWTDRELADDDLRRLEAAEVSIITANLSELVCETLADGSAALAEADTLQRNAAELVQKDDRPAAMRELGEAIGIWVAVREAIVKSAEAMNIDLEEVRVGDHSIHEVLARLSGNLRSLRTALKADDPVGLSDTLLYDLPEVVGEWRVLLDTMRSRVQEMARQEGTGS